MCVSGGDRVFTASLAALTRSIDRKARVLDLRDDGQRDFHRAKDVSAIDVFSSQLMRCREIIFFFSKVSARFNL